MTAINMALLCFVYILGLLSTGILGLPSRAVPWEESAQLILAVTVLGGVLAIIVPRWWRTGPRPKIWIAAGIVGALATVYLQLRIPHPLPSDISQFIPASEDRALEKVVIVQGKIDSVPRLTRSQKAQFWLDVVGLSEVESRDGPAEISQEATGKLYVTAPLLQATGLYPGQVIAVTGNLYEPEAATNPGAFDFKAFLAKEGTFAGMRGRQINGTEEHLKHPWGWWQLRQRIVRAQIHWLGSPAGPLVSSIVLGGQAVDLPYDIRDKFVQTGLAHALAASGFQISLILGLVVTLTKRLSKRSQLVWGVAALVVFVGLTGLQPSVARAAVMGLGALIALATQRKTKPLGSLLLAATLLLLFNPLWIWDLAFQLSFLATLGLVVTVPPLTKQLDWLPPAIAILIAVPLAASLWTLPLLIYVFGVVAPYSIVLNIITTPLISIISIGGIISALAAVIFPLAGSAIAWLLYFPTQLLIELVQFFSQLPGNSVAVGTISLVQLFCLYGLIGLILVSRRWGRQWWLVGLTAVAVVVLPVWQTQAALIQATVLGSNQDPVLVVQNRGQVTLINSGGVDTARFTVLPFLQKQGIDRINYAVALNSQPQWRSGWLFLLDRLSVKNFYSNVASPALNVTQPAIAKAVKAKRGDYQALPASQISAGAVPITLLNAEPPVLHLQIDDHSWLLLGESKLDQQENLVATVNLPRVQVLWWSGEKLAPELLEVLQPQVAIASANTVEQNTALLLESMKTEIYWTGRDGAIQWTPAHGLETTLDALDKDVSLE
ncbi:MAG: ComEC/Rec2 family competence protein [Kastovskya adunca ATA6-11-RM4]|jgi:competence protein ComEC|nr:ComEC/Rec2 family competence protein [Kastovskya adunca ATA6-11-RM4]